MTIINHIYIYIYIHVCIYIFYIWSFHIWGVCLKIGYLPLIWWFRIILPKLHSHLEVYPHSIPRPRLQRNPILIKLALSEVMGMHHGPQIIIINRRKFRSETSDNMDSWKAEVRRVRRDKIRRKKMQMREKVGKSRNTVFFQWFVAPVGRKVGSLKRRVRSQLARWEMKSCTPLWREAHFQVKMYKAPQCRTTFGSWDVEKVHAVVARSTFPSQNVQNTSVSDHFWKLRCRKSARRCGAKHISKWKCTKHLSVGPLLEVEMSKKCTPLWREAHFEVKMYKTPVSDHFWKLRCRKSARRCGAKHISKWKCTKHLSVGPLLEVEMSKKCTPLWREAHFEVKSVKNWRSRTTFGGSDVEKVSKKCTPLWREAHFEVKSVKNWGFWAFFDVKMSKK